MSKMKTRSISRLMMNRGSEMQSPPALSLKATSAGVTMAV